jgi:hypothetical protein
MPSTFELCSSYFAYSHCAPPKPLLGVFMYTNLLIDIGDGLGGGGVDKVKLAHETGRLCEWIPINSGEVGITARSMLG